MVRSTPLRYSDRLRPEGRGAGEEAVPHSLPLAPSSNALRDFAAWTSARLETPPFRLGGIFCWLLLAWGAIAPPLSAQGRAPHLTLTSTFEAPRSQAPVQVRARLAWTSPTLLEGRLRLDFYAGEQKVHSWESRDVILSASELILPVMVPPVILQEERISLDVWASFITADSTYRYEEEFNLPYWIDSRRVLVIGIVHPDSRASSVPDFTTPSQDHLSWIRPFRIDDVFPDPAFSRHFACRAVPVDSEELPDHPLELVAFNLLVITGDGFNSLNERQLHALADWTEGGGALCLAGRRAGSPMHQEFLRRLFAASSSQPELVFDAHGNTGALLEDDPEWVSASPGVGRALVTFRPVDVTTPEWREAVFSLFRVRREQIGNIVSTGTLDFKPPQNSMESFYDPYYRPVAPTETFDFFEAGLQPLLLPERVEGVPFRTVAILLTVCLLAIAPGEYLLLSWLNRRRWTWLVFPSLALGFSIYTVHLAQSHMGASDHRSTLKFVDLTHDGRAARVSRFELFFAATEKQLSEDLTDVLVAPLEQRDEVHTSRTRPRSQLPRGTDTEPGILAGRVPRHYTSVRNFRQWRPQLARFTAIGSPPRPAGDEERSSDLPRRIPHLAASTDLLSDPESRQRMVEEIQASLSGSQVYLVHQDRMDSAGAGTADVPSSPGDHPVTAKTKLQSAADLAFIASIRQPQGLFQVVSQVSPTAAGNVEDLALLDRSDPHQWLLLIVTGDEHDNYTVYRRLFRGRAEAVPEANGRSSPGIVRHSGPGGSRGTGDRPVPQ